MQTQVLDSEENMKSVIVKQNNMITQQSNQMLSMVDVIDVYTKETNEMKQKLDSCANLNAEMHKNIIQTKAIFEIQMLSVVLLLLLIVWYFRQA